MPTHSHFPQYGAVLVLAMLLIVCVSGLSSGEPARHGSDNAMIECIPRMKYRSSERIKLEFEFRNTSDRELRYAALAGGDIADAHPVLLRDG